MDWPLSTLIDVILISIRDGSAGCCDELFDWAPLGRHIHGISRRIARRSAKNVRVFTRIRIDLAVI